MLLSAIHIALRERFNGQEAISKAELIDFIRLHYRDAKSTTLAWRLHELTQENVLVRVGFGLYRFNDRPVYSPEPSLTLQHISDRLNLEFPHITCCVWDTRLLSSLMIHQPMKHLYLVEVDREAATPVYYRLRSKQDGVDCQVSPIYLYDDWLVLNRRGTADDNPVIVKPLISEAPLRYEDKFITAPLEKILVDLLADHELYQAYQEEADYMFREALTRFVINRDKLRRYARRRNRLPQIQTLLDKATDPASNHLS